MQQRAQISTLVITVHGTAVAVPARWLARAGDKHKTTYRYGRRRRIAEIENDRFARLPMPKKRIEDRWSVESAESGAAAVERRIRNRAYMRRWRANAKSRTCERARRMARYYERKARKMPRENGLGGAIAGATICAICSIRPSVRMVSRLRVSEMAASGYEEVLMPYCGEC